MAGFFQRLFTISKSESHAALDKLEDPIKMTEQGIRDLKKDLQAALSSLAQVKALAIRMKTDGDNQLKLAADYERKAMMLLKKQQEGSVSAEQAESLATEALSKKNESEIQASTYQKNYEQQKAMSDNIQKKVTTLQNTVRKYENELITLRARAKTATSMKKINQQLAAVDSSSTLAMLEKMKEKVNEEESLASAYGDIAQDNKSLDDQIDSVLDSSSGSGSDALAELKKKMGMS